jgi:hypothetical protein
MVHVPPRNQGVGAALVTEKGTKRENNGQQSERVNSEKIANSIASNDPCCATPAKFHRARTTHAPRDVTTVSDGDPEYEHTHSR